MNVPSALCTVMISSACSVSARSRASDMSLSPDVSRASAGVCETMLGSISATFSVETFLVQRAQYHATILQPTLFGVVAGDRLAFTIPLGGHGVRDAAILQVLEHRLRSA